MDNMIGAQATITDLNSIPQISFSSKTCRICHDEECTDMVYSPCNCKGSLQYIHGQCLLTWIKKKEINRFNAGSNEGFVICEICKGKIEIEICSVRLCRNCQQAKQRIIKNFLIVVTTILLTLIATFGVAFLAVQIKDMNPQANSLYFVYVGGIIVFAFLVLLFGLWLLYFVAVKEKSEVTLILKDHDGRNTFKATLGRVA